MSPSNLRILAASGALLLSGSVLALGSSPKPDDDSVNARIAPVARVEMAGAPATAGGKRTGEELYKTVCSVCHAAGVANAPKFGDKAAWAPRIALGLDGLVKSAIAGKNAMPARGGSDASDLELTRAIVYMANKGGASFKEPAK
jgi:cytochrome c5